MECPGDVNLKVNEILLFVLIHPGIVTHSTHVIDCPYFL